MRPKIHLLPSITGDSVRNPSKQNKKGTQATAKRKKRSENKPISNFIS
jgi:hypothetical protein